MTNKVTRYIKYIMWWFDIRIDCERILFIELRHSSPHIFTFLNVCMRTSKFYCHNKFPLYNAVLATTVTMVPTSSFFPIPHPLVTTFLLFVSTLFFFFFYDVCVIYVQGKYTDHTWLAHQETEKFLHCPFGLLVFRFLTA